jgi:hypothetical protein
VGLGRADEVPVSEVIDAVLQMRKAGLLGGVDSVQRCAIDRRELCDRVSQIGGSGAFLNTMAGVDMRTLAAGTITCSFMEGFL